MQERLRGTLFTGTLSHTRKREGDVVSGLKGLNVIRLGMRVNIRSKKGLDLHIEQCRTD